VVYLLRGGPRDRQLVDDLPRGYRHVSGPAAFASLVQIEGIPIDSAVWDAGARREAVESGPEFRPRLRAL
jgi:hypothetical protein